MFVLKNFWYAALFSSIFSGFLFSQEEKSELGFRLQNILIFSEEPTSTLSEIHTSHYQEEGFNQLNFNLLNELSIKNNLNVTQNGAIFGLQNIYLRGASSDQINIVFDGIELNDPSHPRRGANLSDLSSYMLESFDVYYGTSGGAESIDSSSATIDIRGVEVDKPVLGIKIGQYDTYAEKVIVPLHLSDRNKHQVEIYNSSSRGISVSENGKENDGNIQNKIKIKGNIRPSNNSQLEYVFVGQRIEEDLDFSGGKLGVDDPNYVTKKKLIAPIIRWKSKIGCNNLNASYQKSFRNSKTDNFRDLGNVDESFYVNHATHVSSKLSLSSNCFENNYLGFLLQRDLDSMSESQVGINPTKMDKTNQEINSFGIESLYEINNENKLETTLKLQEIKGKSYVSGAKLGFYNMINSSFSITPSISFSRKIPSIYQLYSSFGNENLNAEKYKLYQLYLKYFSSSKLDLSLTPFYGSFNDMIDYVSSGNTSGFKNVGEVENYGFEFQQSAKISTDFGEKFSANYLRSINKNSNEPLPLRPMWQLSQTSFYKMNDFIMELQLQYVHKRWGGGAVDGEKVWMPSYILIHSGFSCNFNKNLKTSLLIQNLLNKKYNSVPGYSTLGLSLFSDIVYTF